MVSLTVLLESAQTLWRHPRLGAPLGTLTEAVPGCGISLWRDRSQVLADRPGTPLAGHGAPLPDQRLPVLCRYHNNQVIIRDILEHNSHSVDIVPNGREAVRAAKQRPYDLILMDVRMPIMDGLEATRRIRESLPKSPHVPIVALTAHAMNGVRDECLAAGMDDYISKPFTIAQVNEMIAKCTGARAV